MLYFSAVPLKPHQTNVFTTRPWSIFSPGFLPFEAHECAGVSEPISPRAWPHLLWFPGGSVVKNLSAIPGDLDAIPGSGGSPGEGKGSPLQHSCLENPVERGAWRAMVHRVAKSRIWLKHLACTHPLDQGPFVEKTVFAPLYCLCSLVKDQLTVFMWVHFWTLFCSTDLFVYSFVSTTLPWLL